MKRLLNLLKDNQIGSSLIQIPVTMAIIGGLSVAGTSLTDVMPEARDTRRAADAYQVTMALALYYDDHLRYPIYTGTDPETSWEFLQDQLEPEYIYEFPSDPSAGQDYLYWSDGQIAKVIWTSEVTGEPRERWIY